MIVQELALHNWMCFRGRHRVRFEATAHGVRARWGGNARRSNWGGKTALLEAIRFALYGLHRKRFEDGWITRGEKEGGVRLILCVPDSKGLELVEVSRTRRRGSSTKLEVIDRQNGNMIVDEGGEDRWEPLICSGDEAQLAIDRATGLNAEDFDASVYLGQKRMSRFVTGEPAKRMETVAGWLRLAPLERAAKSVADQLAEEAGKLADIAAKDAAAREALDRVRLTIGLADPGENLPEAVAARVLAAEERLARAAQNAALFEDQHQKLVANQRDFADARRYHQLVAEGTAARATLDAAKKHDLPRLRARLDESTGALRLAQQVARDKRTLARGEFDGTCPVGGVQCPIKAELNANARKNADLYDSAAQHEASLQKVFDADRQALQDAQDDERAAERLASSLESKRAEARRLMPAARRVLNLGVEERPVPETDADLAQARANQDEASTALLELRVLAAEVKRNIISIAIRADERDARQARVELLREAAQILGRRGAQRALAEAMLGEVEQGANRALADCGIALHLAVRWARDGKDPAKRCEACGQPFPSSAKVKICARCGAERGLHQVDGLEVESDSESGAADDLAGIVFQLAAAAWLRRDRGAAWSTAFLDEPTASLDQENRSLLAGHLPALLRGMGFVQAFVVSHDESTTNAFAARVEVEAGPDGSRIVGGEDVEERVQGEGGAEGAGGADAGPEGAAAAAAPRRGARGGRKVRPDGDQAQPGGDLPGGGAPERRDDGAGRSDPAGGRAKARSGRPPAAGRAEPAG